MGQTVQFWSIFGSVVRSIVSLKRWYSFRGSTLHGCDRMVSTLGFLHVELNVESLFLIQSVVIFIDSANQL